MSPTFIILISLTILPIGTLLALQITMITIKRLVIADDLTGANDTGVHFLSDSENVEVVIDTDLFSMKALDHSVHTLVINTGTRNAEPLEAARKVKSYLNHFLRYSPKEIYKKIDSTLRGNVGAEIDALMAESGYALACVAPAVPRNGRTTVNGICFVDGIPLYETEFAQDPFSPVRSSDAATIISGQSERKIGVFTLEKLRAQRDIALTALKEKIKNGCEILIVDSETSEDLILAKNLFSLLDQKVLYVGAAGFFHAIGTKSLAKPHLCIPHRPKILFVTGSMMKTSKKQTDWLIERNYIGKTFTVISREAVSDINSEVSRVAHEVSKEFNHNTVALIQTDRDTHEIAHTAERVGLTVSKIVQEVIRRTHIDVLVVTGGETARNILSRLKVDSLYLIDEALPAVPVSLMRSPVNSELLFISKAGSYGNTDVLEGIITYLNQITTATKTQENM